MGDFSDEQLRNMHPQRTTFDFNLNKSKVVKQILFIVKPGIKTDANVCHSKQSMPTLADLAIGESYLI